MGKGWKEQIKEVFKGGSAGTVKSDTQEQEVLSNVDNDNLDRLLSVCSSLGCPVPLKNDGECVKDYMNRIILDLFVYSKKKERFR